MREGNIAEYRAELGVCPLQPARPLHSPLVSLPSAPRQYCAVLNAQHSSALGPPMLWRSVGIAGQPHSLLQYCVTFLASQLVTCMLSLMHLFVSSLHAIGSHCPATDAAQEGGSGTAMQSHPVVILGAGGDRSLRGGRGRGELLKRIGAPRPAGEMACVKICMKM